MKVLVIDIGGSHVKFLATGVDEPRSFDSGPDLTPREMVKRVSEQTADWEYQAVSLGYPGMVGPDGPEAEPGNLGDGWVGFDFAKAFDKPVRVVNDAAMQALGGYKEGRMLFLGLGTGLGSALVTERVVIPLELGCLTWSRDETLADRLGKAGLQEHGEDKWKESLRAVVGELMKAFQVDEILLGGGNSRIIDPPPEGCRIGGNEDAIAGGFRLWDEWVEGHDFPPSGAWRVVR